MTRLAAPLQRRSSARCEGSRPGWRSIIGLLTTWDQRPECLALPHLTLPDAFGLDTMRLSGVPSPSASGF
jgi:hypothetical protein